MGAKFFYRNIDLVYFINNKLIKNNLITQKDRMLLSFSGGQDSICFVFILNQLYSQLEFDITFFWCHHLWQTDSFYLMQQITKLSFLLQFNSCFPIPLNYISSELLARKWRQKCSYRVSLFYNYSKICLAHTFNDKVENIFLNFIRGTGLIGLAPLRWTQFISKSNITNEKYLSCSTRSLSKGYAKHNYLNNSCFTPCKSSICKGYTNRRFVTPTKMNPDPIRSLPHDPLTPTGSGVRGMRVEGLQSKALQRGKTKINSYPNSISLQEIPFVVALPHTQCKALLCKRVRGMPYQANLKLNGSSTKMNPYPYPFGVKGKGYASDMCILQDNSDKLKNLTKQVIKKFIQRDSQLLQIEDLGSFTSCKSKICQLRTPCKGMGYKSSISTALEPSVRRKPPLKCNFSGDICMLEEDCYIVRPLLSISRIELNKICYFWKLPIYPDKSNQKVKFFRNRVRGQLLPTIKLFFNLNIENIFLQLAKIIETEDYCLTQIVNEFTKNTDVYHSKLNIY